MILKGGLINLYISFSAQLSCKYPDCCCSYICKIFSKPTQANAMFYECSVKKIRDHNHKPELNKRKQLRGSERQKICEQVILHHKGSTKSFLESSTEHGIFSEEVIRKALSEYRKDSTATTSNTTKTINS